MKIENEFSNQRLRRLRNERELTQERVAQKVGCTIQTYRSWEKHGGVLAVEHLQRLADLFNVSTDYLLCRTDDLNIGNAEISEATGLSETSIEVLRFLNKTPEIIGNLEEYQNDTVRFINRALEIASVQIKRIEREGEEIPVYTIFSEMEKYANSGQVTVEDDTGEKKEIVFFSDGQKLISENTGRLYRESVMTMIRKELDYFQSLETGRKNNG